MRGASARWSAVFSGRSRVVGGGDPAADRFEERRKPAVQFAQFQLARQQFRDLAFHALLVKQLPAGDAVHLRPERRDTVFVGVPHARLAGDGGADEIITEDQIGGCCQAAQRDCRRDATGKGRHPRADREVPDRLSARDDDCVGGLAFAENLG